MPTFIKIALGSIISFALIRWINVEFNIVDVKEMIWELLIPLTFPWIPIKLWLRQRLRILNFKKEKERRRLGFQVIAWICIVICMAISQAYLTTATGKLAVLKNIDEIAFKEKVRYYKIKTFAIDTTYGGNYTDFYTSGKHKEILHFNSYFVAPITNPHALSVAIEKKYWYGIAYQHQISNRLGSKVKEEEFKTFYNSCLAKLKVYNFYDLDHFERVPTSDEKDNYFEAIKTRTYKAPDSRYIVLTPVKGTYESRNGNKLIWLFGSFSIGLSVFSLALSLPGYSKLQHEKFLLRSKNTWLENFKSDLKFW